MKAGVIFPNQLFAAHPAIRECNTLILAEDPLFFGDRKYHADFHKKKLILHRASMKSYADKLGLKKKVIYLNYCEFDPDDPADTIIKTAAKEGADNLIYAETSDFEIEKRIARASRRSGIELSKRASPGFLTDEKIFDEVFGKGKNYLMAKFYTAQRKRLGILINEFNEPVGGKWSFDSENRRRLPREISVPDTGTVKDCRYIRDATRLVEERFAGNPGTSDGFNYPVDHATARSLFMKFLDERFEKFGDYEDAIDSERPFLFHSVLTPAMNIGLITPLQVVESALEFAEKNQIRINSLEGFIRQVIGWREFIRLVYIKEGVKQRTANFWGFKAKMPVSFYEGSTGIFPFDTIVKRVQKYAYCHHIERLMILGNFMLLCEIDPDEVYRWFMEMFIDSYDWVMVPNVYGMSQFADGGIMATKPYISSSNYILKMSNFKRGSWCEVWDGLYWRFVYRHSDFFRNNHRLSMMAKQLEKMEGSKLKSHIAVAENFLKDLK